MRQWGKWECRTRSGSPGRAWGSSAAEWIPRVHSALAAGRSCRRPRRIPPRLRLHHGYRRAPAAEAGASEPSTFEAYLAAFLVLDRHELAALALTLGILCFAVVTAILLVRTRRRLAETEAAARDESTRQGRGRPRLCAATVRAANPRRLGRRRRRAGNPRRSPLVTDAARRSACSPSALGSSPETAGDMERAVDALRAAARASR